MREVKLRTNLATRAFCDKQELEELSIAITFISFSYVGDNGNGGTPYLISKREIATKACLRSNIINSISEHPS